MIYQAVKNISSLLSSYITQQGAIHSERYDGKKPRLFDMLEARLLIEKAKKKGMRMGEILGNEPPGGKKPLHHNIRKKVKELINPRFDHPEVLDEVTEKLVDAASNDPFYKRWFD